MGSKAVIALPSVPESDAAVLAFVEQFIQQNGIEESVADRLLLATSEAATNGMKHGNLYNADKYIRICLEKIVSTHCILVTVEDEGNGFDSNTLENPLEEDYLLRTSGRGVFLMRTLSDEITFANHGKSVRMFFGLTKADNNAVNNADNKE